LETGKFGPQIGCTFSDHFAKPIETEKFMDGRGGIGNRAAFPNVRERRNGRAHRSLLFLILMVQVFLILMVQVFL